MNTAAAVAERVQAAWILKDGRGDCQPVVLRQKDEKRIEIHKHLRVRDARLPGVPCGQPEGLGGEAMNTLPLFDQSPMPDAPQPTRGESIKAERRRKRHLAYNATSAAWKDAVYSFAVDEFLPAHGTFIFEELSVAYEAYAKKFRKPDTVEKRAFAGLRLRLIREGLIEAVKGQFDYRSQGSASQVYRTAIYGGTCE